MKSGYRNFEDFDLFYKYTQDVDRFPLLSLKEEQKLMEKIKKGNKRALDKLISSNLRFVIKIAFLFRGRGLPITELINEGNLGLIRAAREFDTGKNVKFITYAVWWIRQSINQALVEKVRTVRIPAYNEQVLKKIGKSRPNVTQYIGGEQGIDKNSLADELSLSEEKLTRILNTGGGSQSIEDIVNNGAEDLFIPQGESPSAWQMVEENSQKETVESLVGSLNPREKKVVEYFFGLGSNKIMNLREISDLLNISRERVRQIKESALDKLRDLKLSREVLAGT